MVRIVATMLVAMGCLATVAEARSQPPTLPNSFTVDVGRDLAGGNFQNPTFWGSCTLTKVGNQWTGGYNGIGVVVYINGNTVQFEIRQGGRVVGSNTVLDTPGGKLQWRVTVPGAAVLITQR